MISFSGWRRECQQAHAGTVSTIECSNSAAILQKLLSLTIHPALNCAGGWLDANSGQILLGCATGAYLGVASASNPPSLVRGPPFGRMGVL